MLTEGILSAVIAGMKDMRRMKDAEKDIFNIFSCDGPLVVHENSLAHISLKVIKVCEN